MEAPRLLGGVQRVAYCRREGLPYPIWVRLCGLELEALYGIEEGITRGLWPKSSPTDSKGKKPSGRHRSGDVGAISSVGMRPPRGYQAIEESFYIIPSTPSPTNYYSFYTKTDATILSAGYAFETSFSEAHGGWHDIDHCTALRHAIQDLIYQGLVNLGQPSVTTNPLHAHSIYAMPPPPGDIHHIDLIEDDSFHTLQFDLRGGVVPIDSTTPLVIRCQDTFVPFILWPKDDDLDRRDIQIVTHSGRIAQSPPLAFWPFEGTVFHEEVRERMIRIETTTTVEGLIHMMTTGRATCIVFLDVDLPPEGLDHVHPLYITVGCSGHRVPSALLERLNPKRRPWIHRAGAIPSSLHLKVKFIHDGQIIMGPNEFIAAIDHDTMFGLGFILTEADYRYMARLRKEKLSDGAPDTSVSMVITSSLDRASLLSLCFPYEVTDDGVVVDPIEMIDGVVSHDEYRDEMKMMTMSQITNIVQLQLVSPFDMFGVSTTEVVEESQTILVPELLKDDGSLFEGTVSHISISVPYSPIPQIFDVDDEIVQPNSDRDSFDHDSDPIDEKVSPATDERHRLIHLLRSYLDVFAWSYEDMVKEEIQNQLSVGFISVVEYPKWLANVVPISKKDGKVRVCVDFRDLNKASTKDDFPLPHIDLLVDSTIGHSILSFMDEFSGYNQILMALKDMEKTTFITEWGTYYYRLRPNPKKCTFGVTSGKLLGHMVNEQGIEVDPNKIKVILDMPVSKIEKEIEGFLGRLQYISRFIARLIRHIVSHAKTSTSSVFVSFRHGLGMRLRHYMTRVFNALDIPPGSVEILIWQKSIKGSIISDHLASLPTSEDRPVDDDFPDEKFVAKTSLSGWCMYFNGAANQLGYEIGVLLVSLKVIIF
ncbi:Transposon Ty3-I Gag-Pol polyprotein [Vitis vinifera]|uniref:Transposon Ty3-I Gag-Pol polyprotein n=1 Tax=Vitis vinifera TaxID=29760 RepID=A0A438DH55_VITVI|nr:Transposon Ty3-I Gag-Pol polyprotein [Vitis vinifera]